MKTIQLLFSSLLLGCLFWGSACQDQTHNTGEKTENSSQEEVHEVSNNGLTRNNGAKWVVNDEMKPHVDRSEAILTEYVAAGNTNFESLAEYLKAQDDSLISSCTMKGEAHEELHKWLHPHLELVKALQETKDETEAAQLVSKLKHSFKLYREYFE